MKSLRFLSKRLLWFFWGAACFMISQPLLRLPILEKLQQSTDFMLMYALNPLLIGILIAFSAGLLRKGSASYSNNFYLNQGAGLKFQVVIASKKRQY